MQLNWPEISNISIASLQTQNKVKITHLTVIVLIGGRFES